MLLFNTTNQLLNPAACSGFPATSPCDCDIFLSFFADNISGLRSNFNAENLHLDQATCPILLTELCPISAPDLFDMISHLHPPSCPTDIIPTKFLKEVLPVIAPCLLSIVNQSLSSGCIPDYFKTACVFPLFKKPTLDPTDLANYRPIFKLQFISKILKKAITHQLLQLIESHNIFDKFQSSFRQKHSTETGLLKVTNDILMHAHKDEFSILLLLDLSAAFDTIDHAI